MVVKDKFELIYSKTGSIENIPNISRETLNKIKISDDNKKYLDILVSGFGNAKGKDDIVLKNLNDLEYGKFNILSVKSSKIYSIEPTDIDLVITPGVAFDVEGNRLGMGAGFYDVFFSRTSYVKTVGLSLSCQLIDSVPSMNHDYKLNYI